MARYQPKYFYQEKTLQEYCKEKEFNYSSARNFISKMKKTSDLSDEKIVELAVASLEKGKTKYFYHGKTLAQYCKDNDIDNTCVRKKIRKLIESGEYGNSCTDEIIKKAIDYVLQDKVIYYIGNQTLGEYCAGNGIVYMSIINKINTYKKKNPNSKLSNSEITIHAVENYLPYNTIYYVEGESLITFCNRMEKDITTFVRKLKELPNYNNIQRKRTDIPLKLAKSIIENIKGLNGTIYYYSNQPLRQFCLKNNLSYESITSLIKEYENKGLVFSVEEIVNKYIKRKIFQERVKDKQELKQKCNNSAFVIYYCKKYDISLLRVKKLIRLGYEPYIAINIIYYLGDLFSCNEKSIMDDKLKELNSLIGKEDKSLDDLLLLQGLGFKGFELLIVKKVEGMIVNIIKKYNVPKEKFIEYKEFLEEIVLNTLNKEFTVRPAQFITYLQKSLRGSLVNYFYNNSKVSMNSADYNIGSSATFEADIEEEYTREERIKATRQIITCLNKNEFLFITRKYGFIGLPLTIEEMQLQYYPESSIEELKNMEMSILNKLRKTKEVQKLLIKD